MSAKFFLDTNILIYCFLDSEEGKRAKARELLERALFKGEGIVSWQVVQEFLNVAGRKHPRSFSPSQMRIFIEKVLDRICDVFPTGDLYKETIDIAAETKYSFYDSLIIASALEGRCGVLYTEDLHPGQTVRGLRITNPF